MKSNNEESREDNIYVSSGYISTVKSVTELKYGFGGVCVSGEVRSFRRVEEYVHADTRFTSLCEAHTDGVSERY